MLGSYNRTSITVTMVTGFLINASSVFYSYSCFIHNNWIHIITHLFVNLDEGVSWLLERDAGLWDCEMLKYYK